MRKVHGLLLSGSLLTLFVIASRPAYAGTAGDLDLTFGTRGVTVTAVSGANGIVNSILLQSDGKILVFVGGAQVLRYTTAGVLDANFANNGVAVLATSIGGSLALQPNGQIVIGGVFSLSTGGAALGAEQLNTDGSQDTSFGSGGLGYPLRPDLYADRQPSTSGGILISRAVIQR